jgi:hypothetical protein
MGLLGVLGYGCGPAVGPGEQALGDFACKGLASRALGLAVPAVDSKHVFYIDNVVIGQLDLKKYVVLDVPDLNPFKFCFNFRIQFFYIFRPARKTILNKHTLLLVLTHQITFQELPIALTTDLQKLSQNFHPNHNPKKKTPTSHPNPNIHQQICPPTKLWPEQKYFRRFLAQTDQPKHANDQIKSKIEQKSNQSYLNFPLKKKIK